MRSNSTTAEPAPASAETLAAEEISRPLTYADIDSDEKLALFRQQQREARIRAGEEVEKIPIDKDAAIDEFLASLESEKPAEPDALKAADKLLAEVGEPYTPPPPKPPKSAETPDLKFAPGCFGFALVYDAGKEVCQDCPFEPKCAEIALHNLARLREVPGIKIPKKIAEAQEPAAATKTVKVRKAKPKTAKATKSGAERVRRYREKTKHFLTGKSPAIVSDWSAEFPAWIRRLKERLLSPTASARKLRRHARQIAEDWRAYQRLAGELGRAPGPSAFGRMLGVDRSRGRDRLHRLVSLESVTHAPSEHVTHAHDEASS